jgi:hypothetical protein
MVTAYAPASAGISLGTKGKVTVTGTANWRPSGLKR